jgi:hypothetical protein
MATKESQMQVWILLQQQLQELPSSHLSEFFFFIILFIALSNQFHIYYFVYLLLIISITGTALTTPKKQMLMKSLRIRGTYLEKILKSIPKT